ncbi:proP [Symbiodinium natans]|uniref:ProP protein n=1 Tax=Symbiodinium natans TaxID=878477 RepID=A0A812IFL2_9DINO|nr:proP [Symbiodinium natans]
MPVKAVQTWEVIGGAISGGLLVRTGKGLGSGREPQRLRTGSVIEEVELDGDRLHYKLLEGAGPVRGWVSTKLNDRELLQRCTSTSDGRRASGNSTKEKLQTAAKMQVTQMDVLAVALNVASLVQTGPHFKVTKVCGESLLEIAPSDKSVSFDDFWPPDCSLTADRRHYLYWAIVCSSSCDTWTLALAMHFKELSDYGVIITHDSRPVVNFVVLHTPSMDVGDLLPTSVELLEPISGARVSMFSTPASQLALKTLGPEVQQRLGWGVSSMFNDELRSTFAERFGERSLSQTVPHWWIAAVVQGDYGLYMVHIDLCGPAYGTFCRSTSAMKSLPNGKELPLDYFITPYYVMTPFQSHQLFFVHPESMNYAPADAKFTALHQIRHLRCFYHGHSSYITATPLPSFVDDEKLNSSWLRLRSPTEEGIDTVHSWKEGLQSVACFLRAEIFKALEPGTCIEVDSTCKSADCAGKLGKVLLAAERSAESADLLIQLDGVAEPVRIESLALKIFPRYVQYLTLVEMSELVNFQLALLDPQFRLACKQQLPPMPSELIGYLRREHW